MNPRLETYLIIGPKRNRELRRSLGNEIIGVGGAERSAEENNRAYLIVPDQGREGCREGVECRAAPLGSRAPTPCPRQDGQPRCPRTRTTRRLHTGL